MATKIVTKNSSTASAVPTASDLVQGELAVNVTDKRLFTEDNGGSIVELGTNPYNFTANHNGSAKLATTSTGIDVTGTATMDGLTVDASSAVVQSATGTASPIPTTFNISTTSSASDWTTTSPWGRLAFYSGDSSGSGGKPHVVLDATASNAIGASSSFSISTTSESANTLSKRLNINNIGDISFYDNSGNAKFFWDASAESLGIGTSSPSAPLHVSGSDSTVPIKIDNTGTGGDTWRIWSTNDAASDGGGKLGFYNEDTATRAMTLDSSGNVGIGTSSPTSKLHLYKTGTSDNTLTIQNGQDAYASVLDLRANNDGGAVYNSLTSTTNGGTQHWKIWGGAASSTMAFSTGATERMRIDASGNLLVGTTDTFVADNSSGNGLSYRAGAGDLGVASTNTPAFYANRMGSDGTIADFRKDGTTVGSIGTGASELFIGSNDAYLWTSGNNNAFLPASTVTGGSSDGLLDLGSSGRRFKDLYLSGHANFATAYAATGIYLGAYATPNLLDDYETGTWTPTGTGVTLGSPAGTYTKVGRLVTVNWLFVYPVTSSGSSAPIAGLPFTVATGYTNGGNQGYVSGSAAVSIAHITTDNSTNILYRTANGGVTLTHADLSGATIRGSMTYMTA